MKSRSALNALMTPEVTFGCPERMAMKLASRSRCSRPVCCEKVVKPLEK